MEMLKNAYPCAAVIPERALGSVKGEEKKKALICLGRSSLEKAAAAYSNGMLKFHFKK